MQILIFLVKFVLSGYLILGSALWFIYAFFIAWGAADGGGSFWKLVFEELDRHDPYMYWWLGHGVLWVALMLFGCCFFFYSIVKSKK